MSYSNSYQTKISGQKMIDDGQDYRHKYNKLTLICKQQQQKISKLQQEIRQRCQSYLLEISRYKRHQAGSSKYNQNNYQNQLQKSSISFKQFRSTSIDNDKLTKSVIIASNQLDIDIINISQNLIVAPRRTLSISQQFQIHEYFQIINKQNQQKQSIKISELIQSSKARISVIQSQKNKLVKQLQKIGKQQKNSMNKIADLQKQNGLLVRSEKKLKDKLRRMPDYQSKIELAYKLIQNQQRIKFEEKQNEVIGQSIQKEIQHKLEQIIAYISDQIKIETSNKQKSNIKTQIIQQNKQDPLRSHFQPSLSFKCLQQASTQTQFISNIIQDQQCNSAFNISNNIEITYNNLNLNQQISNSHQNNQSKSIIKQLYTSDISLLDNSQVKPFIYHPNDFTTQGIAPQQQINQKLSMENPNLVQSIRNLEVQNQKLIKELSQMKESKFGLISQIKHNKNNNQEADYSKLNSTNNDMKTSKFTIAQSLQPPYFVEEELPLSSNNQYVKRNFIRKKIVRRNLSATTYRVVSKSREQVDEIVKNKLSQYRQKSKQKADKLKQSMAKSREIKLQNIRKEMVQNRVSEVSEPRDSDIQYAGNEEVTIVEVVTTAGNNEIKTAKIYRNNQEQNVHSRHRF